MRPEFLYPLFKSVESINGIGEKTAGLFKNLLGRNLLIDVLFHAPSGVIQRPRVTDISTLKAGDMPTLKVKVIEHVKPFSRKAPYRIICQIQSFKGGVLEIVFFNYRKDYLIKQLPVGESRFISGAVEFFNNHLQMPHPDYIAEETQEWKIPLIEPVYPLTQGLTNKMVAYAVREALKAVPDNLPEWLDEKLLKQNGWTDFKSSLIAMHHPEKPEDIGIQSKALQRLAYDEMLANQLSLVLMRMHLKKQQGHAWHCTGALSSALSQLLPFELTNAQRRVISEIKQDLTSPYRMNRLLQGDVGSGKTMVALYAMAHVVEAGAQAAMMCPTDILSRQHMKTICHFAQKLGLEVVLLTGREKGKKRDDILQKIASGQAQIIIGTHALFTYDVAFCNLGLVVIDEQHRFGVEQRLFLTQKAHHPDLLVMTATPIPRTLALTGYGDMDLSILDEKPATRKPVDTRVLPLKQAEALALKLKSVIDKGQQIYWVCPLVEESEKSDLANATKRAEELSLIYPAQVGLVHGKMKGDEKDAVMKRFSSSELKVLVSTTVIEVGVDIPNATVMVIEQAERFGLAQLHQLRGRIGRGSEKSDCILLYGYPLSEVGKKRLEIMRLTDDGFVIAEEDLKLRGSGDVLGTRQSGFASFRLCDPVMQSEMLSTARRDAMDLLKTDETMQTPRAKNIKILLYLFEKDVYIKTIFAG